MVSWFKAIMAGISCIICYEIVVAYASIREQLLRLSGIQGIVDMYTVNPTMAILIDAISLIGLFIILGTLIIFIVKALN
jgi:hypothetical protein